MIQVMAGAIIMGCWTAGLLFFRFWRKTRDRLFLMFAAAFWMMAVNRTILAVISEDSEARTPVYVVRLLSFVLIIIAIADKNRASKASR